MNFIIVLLSVFYPLMQENWDGANPPDKVFCDGFNAPTYIDDSALDMQMRFLADVQDPEMRSTVINELDAANNPVLYQKLERMLALEKNESVRADILKVMLSTLVREKLKITPSPQVELALESENPFCRAYACAILLHTAKDRTFLAPMLEKEKSPMVFENAFAFLEPEFNASALISKVDDACRKYVLKHVAKYHPADSALADAFNSGTTEERLAVLQGLAESQTLSASQVLEKASDSAIVQERLLAAGAKGDSETAARLAAKLASDKSAAVRYEACVTLKRFKGFERILAERLDDKSMTVALAAADSLSAHVSHELPDYILKAKNIRALAVVIGASKNTRYASVLLKMLENAPDDFARIECVKSLGILGVPDTEKRMMELVSTSDNTALGAAYACALEKFRSPEAFAELKRLVRVTAPAVSIHAICVTGRIGDAAFSAVLGEALGDIGRSAEYRASAAWALSRMPSVEKGAYSSMYKILLTRCIPVPMSPNIYDNNGARGITFMALRRLAERRVPGAEKVYNDAVKRFENPTQEEKSNAFADDYMLELVRQVRLYSADTLPGKTQIKGYVPDLTYQKSLKGK